MTYNTIYDTIYAGGEKMAGIEKIIAKMKNQPNGIRDIEAQKVLEYYGYRLDRQKRSEERRVGKECL